MRRGRKGWLIGQQKMPVDHYWTVSSAVQSFNAMELTAVETLVRGERLSALCLFSVY